MLEVVEVVLEVVAALEVVVPEVVQLLEDDVVRPEVEHPEVAQCLTTKPPANLSCENFAAFEK